MSNELSRFLTNVRALGYVVDGNDGNGHIRLRSEQTGDYYWASRTPSDYRARRNEIAELERLSGRKLPRQRAGKYRCRRQEVSDFEKTPAERTAAAEIDELVAEAEELRLQFAELRHTRDGIAEDRRIIERFEDIRDRLAHQYYRIIPSLGAVTY
jgi:hypothetical protein